MPDVWMLCLVSLLASIVRSSLGYALRQKKESISIFPSFFIFQDVIFQVHGFLIEIRALQDSPSGNKRSSDGNVCPDICPANIKYDTAPYSIYLILMVD